MSKSQNTAMCINIFNHLCSFTSKLIDVRHHAFSALLTHQKPCQALAAEYLKKMTMIAMRACRRPGTFTWVIPFLPPPVPLLPYSRTSRAPTTSQVSNVKQSNADPITSFNQSTFTCLSEPELLGELHAPSTPLPRHTKIVGR